MRKIGKTTIALLSIIALLSVVLGAVVYQLTIPMSMKVRTAYGLKVEDVNDVEITTYDWGEFAENEIKALMSGDSCDITLRNIGNSDVNLTWISNLPVGWILTIKFDLTPWNSGDIRALPKESEVTKMRIYLQESGAIPDIDYSFNLEFQVVE